MEIESATQREFLTSMHELIDVFLDLHLVMVITMFYLNVDEVLMRSYFEGLFSEITPSFGE